MKVLAVRDTVAEILCSDRIRQHSADVECVPACGDLPPNDLESVVTMLNVPLPYAPGDYDRPKQLADDTLSEGPRGEWNTAGKVVRVGWEAGRGGDAGDQCTRMWGSGDRDVIRPEFGRARRTGERRRVPSFVTGQPTLLLPPDFVRDKVRIQSSSYGAIRETEIAKVIGSVNRYDELDREFLPKRRRTVDHWSRAQESFDDGPGHAPIKIDQVGDVYFVVGGNRRISVARQLGIKRIEAEVTRSELKVPIDEHTDVRSLIVKAEYSESLRAARLDAMRPKRRIEFTRPRRHAPPQRGTRSRGRSGCRIGSGTA